jgi:hypothetical protein
MEKNEETQLELRRISISDIYNTIVAEALPFSLGHEL